MIITGLRPLAHHHWGTTTEEGVGGAHQGSQKGECCQVRLVWDRTIGFEMTARRGVRAQRVNCSRLSQIPMKRWRLIQRIMPGLNTVAWSTCLYCSFASLGQTAGREHWTQEVENGLKMLVSEAQGLGKDLWSNWRFQAEDKHSYRSCWLWIEIL